MKEAGKILVYLFGVLFLGGLIAPPLFWAAQALADAGMLVVLRKYPFQKFLNRGVLVAAVGLLWPLVAWLGIRGWRPPAFRRDVLWARRFGLGALIGAGALGVLGALCLGTGLYRFKGFPGPGVLVSLMGSALAVGLLEEALFRGALAGLLERGLGFFRALWVNSSLFAVVHFLKPDPLVRVEQVDWFSGFALLPHSFHQFARPALVLGGFGTLLVLGLVLGLAVRRTGSLWMSVGFHAGLVFAKGVFSKGTERVGEALPWMGAELQVGLVPVGVLCMAGVLVGWVGRPPGKPGLE